MTLLLDKARSIASPTLAPVSLLGEGGVEAKTGAAVLEIGLVNNMPDAALQATERQFMRLLNAAAGENLVRLHFITLPSVMRTAATKARMDGLYRDFGDLLRTRLDGLIVTGAEPRAPTLPEEPYWRELTELIDWAEVNTRSTIWSCLAAHAAVLHLDGIERNRLVRKRSGIFSSSQLAEDGLLTNLTWPLKVPHSRLNDLDADALTAHGYRILTQSDEAGVDIFTRQRNSRFVFFHGHPEYDALSLQREYTRDVGRFLAGEQDAFPDCPADYFDAATLAALDVFRRRAEAAPDRSLMSSLPSLALRPGVASEIEVAATTMYANWLTSLASEP